MKAFKRIKQLNLPHNNTKIVQWEKPLVPVRVSSVYSENAKVRVSTLLWIFCSGSHVLYAKAQAESYHVLIVLFLYL